MPTIKRKARERPWVNKPKPFEREFRSDVYDTREWRKLRLNVLNESPWCIDCKANGILTDATVVDHIIPISQRGSELDRENLQPLCASCHNRKSSRERGRGGISFSNSKC